MRGIFIQKIFYNTIMKILYWILGIIAGYGVIMFGVLRLIIPFMGFGQYLAPTSIPTEMQTTITELETKSTNQREYLEHAYAYLQSHWQAE